MSVGGMRVFTVCRNDDRLLPAQPLLLLNVYSRGKQGDDTGLLKEVSVESKAVVQKWGVQDRQFAIQRLAFRDGEEHEVCADMTGHGLLDTNVFFLYVQLLAGLANGSVNKLCFETREYTTLVASLFAGPITGLDSRDGYACLLVPSVGAPGVFTCVLLP